MWFKVINIAGIFVGDYNSFNSCFLKWDSRRKRGLNPWRNIMLQLNFSNMMGEVIGEKGVSGGDR